MYIKIFGSILVILSTSAIGHWYSIDFQKRLTQLEYLRQLLLLISGEIQYTGEPLGEIFGQLARRIKTPYDKWLLYLSEQLQNRSSGSFDRIWRDAVDMYLSDLKLTREDMDELKDLGSRMGCTDTQTQLGSIKLYIEKLEHVAGRERETIAAKKRLSNCLGVISGIFIAVILV